MIFKNKVVFIISYENWGSMKMSKHHYAIELGKAGSKVFFINHPDKRKEFARGEVKVLPTDYPNVSVVMHRLLHPYFLKFKLRWLYSLLTYLHVQRIMKKTGSKPDVVWSFDTGNTLPLAHFPDSAIKIYMPVDGPFLDANERLAARDSDVIISVTNQILKAYSDFKKPKLQINHGVASAFLNGATARRDQSIHVGYSGSLIRNDLDTKTFLKIITSHPHIKFEFWGEYDYTRSNIHLPQDVKDETRSFVEALSNQANVVLHGPVSSEVLAEGLRRMDILLICYNIKNDQNHHKVLEYLGTGKTIVSNFLSSYENQDPDLIFMASKEDDSEIPVLFNKVVNNLSHYNSDALATKRRIFAARYSYSNNIKIIEEFLEANVANKLYY